MQLWTLEEVVLERGASELRVHLRSWRVDRTSTSTRTDVATGTQGTNLYRGFFGRRFRRGAALQLAGQQYGTTAGTSLGGGDQLALLGRVGLARHAWSIDAFAVRASRTRDSQERFDGAGGIPALDARRTDAYLRAAYGDTDGGPWAQLIAATMRFDESSDADAGGNGVDTVDTARTHTQYVAAGGLTLGGVRMSATNRVHVVESDARNALSARLAVERPWLAASLYAERRGSDTTSLEEAAIRLAPLPFLALSGAIGREHGGRGNPGDVTSLRAEAGVRLGALWFSGGVLARDDKVLPGLIVYDTAYRHTRDVRARGVFGAIRGRVWRDIFADVYSVHWDAPGPYRAQNHTRAELSLRTRWLRRFPSGNFGFLGSIGWSYRSPTVFPTAQGLDVTTRSSLLTSRVEIRILSAELFWQQQYRLRPFVQDIVPGYNVPRQIQVYGVRWQFWN